MVYILMAFIAFSPLFGAFKMEDHVIPKSPPNTYPSEQPSYYGNSAYVTTPYVQNTPYGSYYAVPTYSTSERFFDNPNWPNVSHDEVTITPTGTAYYGPNYPYGSYGQTTTIYNTPPYNNSPGPTYYYGR
ncbi:MAG: hypothetical protein ACK4HV_00620 [Parachlamydiaceae bacterium]